MERRLNKKMGMQMSVFVVSGQLELASRLELKGEFPQLSSPDQVQQQLKEEQRTFSRHTEKPTTRKSRWYRRSKK